MTAGKYGCTIDVFCSEKSLRNAGEKTNRISVAFKQVVPDRATSMPVLEDYSSLRFNLSNKEADKFTVGRRYKISIS